MADSTLDSWSSTGPLPAGDSALIEASAGTGKTYQTEGLVVRLVAEAEVPMAKVLAITFTRAAAAELRGRVRARLDAARRALESGQLDGDDEVVAHLLQATATERTERLCRVREALADYDQATIGTIHSFCQEVLREHAFAAGQDPRGLEQSDGKASLRRVVEDLVCAVTLRTSALGLDLLRSVGWTRDAARGVGGLLKLADLAAGAHLGTVQPSPEAGDGLETAEFAAWVAEQVRRWQDQRQDAINAYLAWLDTDEGVSSRHALIEAIVGRGSPSPKRLGGATSFTKTDSPWEVVRGWLEDGASPSRLPKGQWDVLSDLQARWDALKSNVTKGRKLEDHELLYALHRETQALLAAWEAARPAVLPATLAFLRSSQAADRRRRGLQTYASMLSDLADALRAEDDRERQPLRDAMRGRFDVALVDEFQDTDEAQWAVIRRVFLDSSTHRLYLVGDPKQAIYRFRGANLGVYFAARRQVLEAGGQVARLHRNFRSDRPLMEAINRLWWDGRAFHPRDEGPMGDALDRLSYGAVEPVRPRRMHGMEKPMQLRWISAATAGREEDASLNKDELVSLAAWCAARRIAQMLQDEQLSIGRREPGRRMRPSDFAVLTRSHREATLVAQALAEHGVLSVRESKDSVVQTSAATWVLHWLDALAQPGSEGVVSRAALTPLLGWTAPVLVRAREADTVDWVQLRASFDAAAKRWSTGGFHRAWAPFVQDHGVLPRLMRGPDGERDATDLLHLTELLDEAQRTSRLDPAGLAEWLRSQMVDDAAGDDDGLRIESDRDAVTLSTLHASKGLQYGVVLMPFSWYGGQSQDGHKPLRYSRFDGSDVHRIVDLHPKGSEPRLRALAATQREEAEEQMRLLYVGLTRARHHLIVWSGPYEGRDASVEDSPLAWLLAPLASAEAPESCESTPSEGDADEAGVGGIWPTAAEAVGADLVEEPPLAGTPTRVQAPAGRPVQLRPWPRRPGPGAGWAVASYSSMASGKGVELLEDPDEPDRPDEDVDPPASPLAPEDGATVPSPSLERPNPELLAPAPGVELHGGKQTGNWLHSVLEHLDFESGRGPDGRSAEALVAEAGIRNGVTREDQHAIAVKLLPSWLDTPLDHPATPLIPAGFRLRRLSMADRLDELQFHLRLGSGEARRGPDGRLPARIDADRIHAALQAASEDKTFRGAPWLGKLLGDTNGDQNRTVFPRIAGFLQGFIDLTFRVEVDGRPRFFVCDYKSNQLAGPLRMQEAARSWGPPPDAPDALPPRLRRWHYTSPVMAWSMGHSAYHLQALVYTVALHRHLSRRLAGYDYEEHVGGHLYLFLRGMEGADAARDAYGAALGVWADRWPRATVEAVSAALGEPR